MRDVGIIGLGKYLPPKSLTNKDLEKMVDTTDEWIITRTGIKERRIAPKDVACSDLATEAARSALKDANLKPEELGLIIVATITSDMQFPSTSCLLQKKLGAKNACCFDISAACTGFIYALVTAKQFISSGAYKNVLVVGAEKLTGMVDWKDRSTCVLFGDGAGACILAPSGQRKLVSEYLASDGEGSDLLKVPAGGSLLPTSFETVKNRLHFLQMQGNEVFKIAVKVMAEAADMAIKRAGLECRDIKLLIPHQANLRILMAVAKKMGLSEDRLFLNVEKYGNMSAASTAVALCEAYEENRVKQGEYVVLVAFGSGLTWGACVIKW